SKDVPVIKPTTSLASFTSVSLSCYLNNVMRLEAVEKLKTGGDREGEAPAEPHGARTCWAMARQEARPRVPLRRGQPPPAAGDVPVGEGPRPAKRTFLRSPHPPFGH